MRGSTHISAAVKSGKHVFAFGSSAPKVTRKGRFTGLTGTAADPAEERFPALSIRRRHLRKRVTEPASRPHPTLSVAFCLFLKGKPFGLGGGQLRLPVGQPVGNLPELHRIAGIEFRI